MPYDPSDRVASPHEDSQELSAIELTFAIPVHVTQDQWGRLHDLMSEIIQAPCNTPKEGVHWLSTEGSKPRWSQCDAKFMGKPVDPTAPLEGEPTFDHSTAVMESSARGFLSEKERQQKLERRE